MTRKDKFAPNSACPIRRVSGCASAFSAVVAVGLSSCAIQPDLAPAPPVAVVAAASPVTAPTSATTLEPAPAAAAPAVAPESPGAIAKEKKAAREEAPRRTEEPASSPKQLIDITPLHSSKDQWTSGPTAAGANFSGQYTKVLITSVTAATGADSSDGTATTQLPYKTRNLIQRALWGKEFNFVLTAKIRIPDTLDLTVPLAIIGHQSNSDGETWLRELSVGRRDFPLFLVRRDGRNANPSVTAEVKGSNSYTSRGAAAGVSALARVAQVSGVAPTVLTQLTKESTKSAAREVDLALSNLLASSVTERTNSDRPLAQWPATSRKTPSGLEINLSVPTDEKWGDARNSIGTWVISFAPPQPSVFSDWSVCSTEETKAADGKEDGANGADGEAGAKDAATAKMRCSPTVRAAQEEVVQEVKPSEILNFNLLGTGTQKLGSIRAYLTQQEWFTSAVADMAATAPAQSVSDLFCRRVVNEIAALDLNDFDARLVLWAVYRAMPVKFPSDFKDAPDCKRAAGEVLGLESVPARKIDKAAVSGGAANRVSLNARAAVAEFELPEASKEIVKDVDFAGTPVGARFQARFNECDARDTCDGKPSKFKCSTDPNRNAVMGKLRDGTLFFDAKMGLDADGSPYSALRRKTDQPQTSLRYPTLGRPSINADRVPFVVIPKGDFAEELGVKVGDIAAVVYKDVLSYAVVADEGPTCKLGEGSIQLHERLGHQVCRARGENGDCTALVDTSIEKNVLYFIFPGTAAELIDGLNPSVINDRIQSIGNRRWERLKRKAQ